jgi:predicted GNAT superfamily acetyltransferase
MAAVLEPYRNAGIGRRLKLAQREDALARGIELIEWTFDPLEVRNAYFNFRLGAIVRRFLPNFYGLTSSPLHGGLPTDRLLAEWWLQSVRVRRAIASDRPPQPKGKHSKPKLERITVPPELVVLRKSNPEEAVRSQGAVRQRFEHCFNSGFAATGIEIKDGKGRICSNRGR